MATTEPRPQQPVPPVPPVPPTPRPPPPTWVQIVGVVFLGLAVVYLMGLVALKHKVDCEDRFLVVSILALCVAIGAGFLGNDAAAKGNIPIPRVADHPMAFSAGGGIAALLIVMGAGYLFYADPDLCRAVTAPEVEQISASRVDAKVVASVTYGNVSIPAGYRLVVQCAGDEKFSKSWIRTTLDNPSAGRAHFEMTQVPAEAETGYIRLLIVDISDRIVRQSETRPFMIVEMRPPAAVATTAPLVIGFVSAALAETLIVSGLVVRADTHQKYGGAPLGIYPALGGSLGRIVHGVSLETGLYTVQKENVFLSSVWVVYEGDLYSADPVRVDLTVSGNVRVGQAKELRLIPKPTPQVAGMTDAAAYLAAELRSATVLAKTGSLSVAAARDAVLLATRRAVSIVPPEKAAELHEVFRKEVGPSGTADQPVQPPTQEEFIKIAQAMPAFERRPDARSEVKRDCSDCKEGEAKAETTLSVPHGVYVDIDNPPCYKADMYEKNMPDIVKRRVADAYYKDEQRFTLSLDDNGLAGVPRVDGAGDIARLLRVAAGQPQVASCTRMVIVLPKTARITRIERSVNSPVGGWWAWKTDPTVEELDANLNGVSCVVKNWSHNADASGTLKVYYRR